MATYDYSDSAGYDYQRITDSNSTFIVEKGVTVQTDDRTFFLQGDGNTFLNHGTVSGEEALLVDSGQSFELTNFADGFINGEEALDLREVSHVTNYGTIQGSVDSAGGVVDNYGSIDAYTLFNGSSGPLTINEHVGASFATQAIYNGNIVLNLVSDDRSGAEGDVGAKSSPGTIGVLSGVNVSLDQGQSFTLNVQSDHWVLGDAETFSSATVAADARFDVANDLNLTTGGLTNFGVLDVVGKIAAASMVEGPGVFLGNGSIAGGLYVKQGGSLFLDAGNGLHIQGDFDIDHNATLHDVIGGQALHVSGDVFLYDATLDLQGGPNALAAGQSQIIIDNTGSDAILGTFHGLNEGSTFALDGHEYSISYRAGDGNDVAITCAADPTPPPAVQTHSSSQGAYFFDNITQAQANSFGSGNVLMFRDAATASQVSVSASADGAITLSYAGKSVVFGPALAESSLDQRIVFNDNSSLIVGQNGSDAIARSGNNDSFVYGFGGADQITLGDGNNHVWGNAPGSQGQSDGADTIVVGRGANYINGNAGNDTITAGQDGSTAANRLFGGADNDVITIKGAGHNSANGNKGADTVDASNATGDNVLRGGQGDDMLRAGHGHDQLMGDMGSDTLVAGTGAGHLTVMTGGQDGGADLFVFHGIQGALTLNGQSYFEEVTDFAQGRDHLALGFEPASIYGTSTAFGDEGAAQAFAQGWLNGHASNSVVATQVGGDTYLFYHAGDTGTVADSVVRLDHVAATSLSTNDFVQAAV